jgi:hypothetical protein
LSERRASRLLGQWRRTQRYIAIQRDEEDALTLFPVVPVSELVSFVKRENLHQFLPESLPFVLPSFNPLQRR